MAEHDLDTYAGVKSRLDEIVDAVRDDNMPLDEALALYEEAVQLGLRASTLLEADIAAQNEDVEAAEGTESSESVESNDSAADAPAGAAEAE